MANFNKWIGAGNLTRDVQVTFLPNGTPCGEFGLAINRKWRPTDGGDMREEVTFVDCRIYGKGAETLKQYVGKGKPLLVEGRLKFDQWEAKEGGKRSKLYVIVDTFQFLGGGRDEGRQAPGERGYESQVREETYGDVSPPDDGNEEVPF